MIVVRADWVDAFQGHGCIEVWYEGAFGTKVPTVVAGFRGQVL